jgi:hypothetical protein
VDEIFRFLVKYELPVYVVVGLFGILALRSTWKDWREWHNAVFGLEKEISFQRLRLSGAVLILLVMIGLSQFCLVTFVVPFLPAVTFLPTPTTDLLETPQPAAGTQVAQIGTPGAAGTAAPPPGTIGCIPGQLLITEPLPGQDVSGNTTLRGVINLPNFGYYKYEFAPQGSEEWKTIAAGDKINPDKEPNDWVLGGWNTSTLTPGDYQLRLVVIDNLGNAVSPCIVPVRVVGSSPAF